MANSFNIPTPDEIIWSISAENEAEITRLIPLIVSELRMCFRGEPVAIILPENTLNHYGILTMKNAFTDAGWTVNYYSSDRLNGSFLEFSK